jgi:UDP-GlcNAc:undecaprenyl-phosphate GlcNAc-1-phosphate transferase
MDQVLRILVGLALAVVPSVLLCRVVMSLGVVDAPTEARKTQAAPVPTLGGVAIALSTLLAISVDNELIAGEFNPMALIVGGGAIIALLVGVVDDVLGLRAVLKLLALTAVGVGVAYAGVRPEVFEPWPGLSLPMPVWLAIGGSALWLVVVMNAVNFMDGANGLAMGMAAIASVGFAVCAALLGRWDCAVMAGALTGALCGFLVWNVSGRLFAGDAGALFVGAVLGGLGLEIVRLRPDLVLVPPILMLPFLSDVLLTLAWRAKHGKKLFEAHRDHSYQIAIKAGLKHWQVSSVHAVWAMNAAIVAILSTLLARQIPVILFVLLLLVSTWLHMKIRRAGVENGLVGKEIA